MTQCAARIARQNSGLQRFTLKFVRQWLMCEDIRLVQIGTYAVASDEKGIPTSLSIHESGIGRRGKIYSRSYQYDLQTKLQVSDVPKQSRLNRLLYHK